MRFSWVFGLVILGSAACVDPAEQRPSASASAVAVLPTASASSSASGVTSAAPLSPQIERARADTVRRLPALKTTPLVVKAFAPPIQKLLESPDEVALYSVSWNGSANLPTLLDGTASSRPDVLGRLPIVATDGAAITAWLYDGVTRPFEGLRCDNPHHAFLFRKGPDAVAIAVCFECGTFAMQGSPSLGASATQQGSFRWDPAFRDFLKVKLEAAGIRDLSSDFRP